MATQTQVLASHMLSDVEPIKGTMDVTTDTDAQRELNRLVSYLLEEPTAPFRPSGSTATSTWTNTDTGASSTNTVPDADNDTEWDNDSDND